MRSRSRSPYKAQKYTSKSTNRDRSRSRSPFDNTHDVKSYKYQSHSNHSRKTSESYDRRKRREFSREKSNSRERNLDHYQNDRDSNRDRKRDAIKENKDRWPNDMYNIPSTTKITNNPYEKFNKKSSEDQFMNSRRLQRELIGAEGVSYVWGKSPLRPES